jgi:hypothetical protein
MMHRIVEEEVAYIPQARVVQDTRPVEFYIVAGGFVP